jgi:hypothetical protein
MSGMIFYDIFASTLASISWLLRFTASKTVWKEISGKHKFVKDEYIYDQQLLTLPENLSSPRFLVRFMLLDY